MAARRTNPKTYRKVASSRSKFGRSRSRQTKQIKKKPNKTKMRQDRNRRGRFVPSTSKASTSTGRGRKSRANSPHLGPDLNKLSDTKGMEDIKFDFYIKKIKKQVSPDHTISGESTRVMDRLMKAILHHIGSESTNKMGRRKVLKPKIIQRALKRVLPKKIREAAHQKGIEALEKYAKSKGKKKSR